MVTAVVLAIDFRVQSLVVMVGKIGVIRTVVIVIRAHSFAIAGKMLDQFKKQVSLHHQVRIYVLAGSNVPRTKHCN